jgi:hypothetical protein
MRTAAGIAGTLTVLLILWEAFESIILPRRVTRRFRVTRLFYRTAWGPVSAVARRLPPGKARQALLGSFGPLSLIVLLVCWATALVFGFGLLQYAARSTGPSGPGRRIGGIDFYMSGTTFFTLGLGDVTPKSPLGRLVTVIEAGTGFGFLAIVIGYLPVIYGAFSRREKNISLLDARAGTPPNAQELIRRYASPSSLPSLVLFLRDWEEWTADLMESHLSYPVLCYYRSQHDNQSWLAALTAVLDCAALVDASLTGEIACQARLTFAIARHAVVDLSQVLHIRPAAGGTDRLGPEALAAILADLGSAGVPVGAASGAEEKLTRLRRMYEPYVTALGERLLFAVPGWTRGGRAANWETSAWEKVSGGGEAADPDAEHD